MVPHDAETKLFAIARAVEESLTIAGA